jgi:1,4-alpha-glucan branching enzyme
LAARVREGRRKEFAHFERFHSVASGGIPDPTDRQTLESARLDWSQLDSQEHQQWLEYFRRLLAIRQRDIMPRIPEIKSARCSQIEDGGAFAVDWHLAAGSVLHLLANLSDLPVPVVGRAAGRMIFATHPNIRAATTKNELAPWSVTWLLERGDVEI